MNILITGGAGFLGSRLAATLLAKGQFRGQPVDRLMLADLQPSGGELAADPRVTSAMGDLIDIIPTLFVQQRWDAVFHLAAAVSAECEADFGLGLHANLDATRALLDACRAQTDAGHPPPVFFFASSVAVFGSDPGQPLPEVVRDDTLPTPQSSYGIHKFVGEQLVADYTRKGFIDGRPARLMTVSVRPGRPNGAASGFLSGLVREPLAGQACNCPVPLDTRVALSSPVNTIAGILAVAEAPREALGGRTAINLPALSVSVGEMIAALQAVAGPVATALITHAPDPAIARIVAGWPARFESRRAASLGLRADPDFHAVLLQYIDDHPDAVKLAVHRRRPGQPG